MRKIILFGIATTVLFCVQAQAKTCVFIDSYHEGYAWSDGIYKGISETLKGKCDLKTHRMDTKRNKDQAFIKKAALKAKAFIEKHKPDVVIMADDNATKEVLVPFYKNAALPVVFCGLNWSIEKYGLPFKNTTGMIEVAPVEQVVKEIKKNFPGIKSVGYMDVDVATGVKNFNWQKPIFEANGLKVHSYFAKDFADWKVKFKEAQKHDFVFLNNNAGINDWNEKEAIEFHQNNTKKISASSQAWMIPFVSFAMSKSSYEQGQWSAKSAIKIMKGKKPNRIPVVTNKSYDSSVNMKILEHSPVKLSSEFTDIAVKYNSKKPASN